MGTVTSTQRMAELNYYSSDETTSSSAAAAAGWLKGPISKQKTVLKDDEWVEEKDDKTQLSIWRSRITGEATAPGVPRPHTWHQVVDKKTGLLYYWCPETNETTELGEERPGPYGRKAIFKQKGQRAAEDAGGGGKGSEKDLTIVQLYNNPLGWLLLGMALWGIAAKALF